MSIKKISLAVADSQYDEILHGAHGANQTITDWILSKLPIEQECKLTVADVLASILTTELTEFTLPQLLSETWESYTKGSKTATGRRIYQMVRDDPQMQIEFIGKNTANHAIYKKKG